MKLLPLSLSLFCCLVMTACGENWSAGGASLGGSGGVKPGTGTGTGVDEGQEPGGNQSPIIGTPITGTDVVKHITYNAPATDYCGVLQRKMYFVNGNGEPVFASQQEVFQGTVAVKIELTNIAKFPIYEKLANCQVPISLSFVDISTDQKERIKPLREVGCEDSVTWRVIPPQKTMSYTFSAGDNYLSDDITEGKIDHYQIGYASYYVQRDLNQLPSEIEDVLKCESLDVTFNTVNKLITATDPKDATTGGIVDGIVAQPTPINSK